jgi:UDP-hydrolysing UDP-N-acetyl-D-glucosamine 2-epimerase
MRKICVVVTARPSYARIKTALEAIVDSPQLELQLVLASSMLLDRYGDAARFVRQDHFEVAAQIYNAVEGENPITSAKSTGLALLELATVFDNLKPDVVVTIADRYETIATSIAAAYTNIPLAHVQGGEVTGSIDEKVRHANTKLADLHFVSNQKAAERVIRMGEAPEHVFVTGCPSIDLAAREDYGDSLDFDPYQRYGGVGAAQVDPQGDYLVVLQHPVTTHYEHARQDITTTLRAIRDLGMPTFWFWPNIDAGSDGTAKGIRSFRELEADRLNHIHFFKTMTPEDFLKLIYHSRCLVGNSSVGIRECAYLGVPVVNIGSRQDGRERGMNVTDTPYDYEAILAAIRGQLEHGRYQRDPIYGDGHAGKRIAEILTTCDLTFEKQLTY